MNDENKDLKEEVKLLKEEIDLLKKQLKENSEGDKKRHDEIKQLQQDHHKESMFWNKVRSFGSFGTPLTVILGLITWWTQNRKTKNNLKEVETKIDKEKKELKETKSSLKELIELVKEIKCSNCNKKD